MRNILLFILFTLCGSADILATSFSYHPVDTLREAYDEVPKQEKKAKKKRGVDPFSFADKKRADKLYRDFGYMASADLYNKLVADGNLSTDVMQKLATAYRLNGESEDAEFWYAQLIHDTSDPNDYLYYAQALQSNDKCEDAVRWYQKYEAESNDPTRSYIMDCDDLDVVKQHEGVELVNLKSLNHESLDYSAIPYADGIVFTSTRGLPSAFRVQDKWTKDNFADLFFAKKLEFGKYEEPEPLRGKLNKKFHDGVATFNSSESVMIFSRNNQSGRNKEGIIDLKLYEARNPQQFWVDAREDPIDLYVEGKMDGEKSFWMEMGELAINSDDFSSCHPALSPDGKRLYFASNREGGYGGMDIWMSRNVNEVWQEPTNLGPIINSSGNELFPFMAKDEKLYYASDGHLGVGGLDIYVGQKNRKSNENSWSIRENLGMPFNTAKDDFGFTINEDLTNGYFTSNRENGMGDDDIYEWQADELTFKEDKNNRRICVFDEETGDRIKDVTVTIETINTKSDDAILTLKPLEDSEDEFVLAVKGQNSGTVESLTTNNRGIIRYRIEPGQTYLITTEKKGYYFQRTEVTSAELMEEREFCIPLAQRNCLTLNGLVQSAEYAKGISGAKVRLLDKCHGGYQETTTDSNGQFEFCIECDCAYQIIGEKEYFVKGITEISTENEACDDRGEIEIVVALQEGDLTRTEDPGYGKKLEYPNGYPPPSEWTPEMMREYFLGNKNEQFKNGQIITLRDIYYDYNKYNIRTDAAADLDYLIALMKMYPSMEIAMTAHTDSRGGEEYNYWLSKNRAKSAKNYVLDQGIAAYRIHSAKGKGELELTNGCSNDIPCSEQEHQQNRRTEIRIVRLDNSEVQIREMGE